MLCIVSRAPGHVKFCLERCRSELSRRRLCRLNRFFATRAQDHTDFTGFRIAEKEEVSIDQLLLPHRDFAYRRGTGEC